MQVTAAYPGREGKEKILETYLNLIYYGNGSYGIRAAAANYFGITDLAELTDRQAAFLAGSAAGARPSSTRTRTERVSPGSEEAAADALRERDLVIGAMVEEGYITARRGAQRRGTRPGSRWSRSRLTSILREPHFSFRVREEAERILGSLPGVTDGGAGGPHRRLSHHHHPRLRAPAGGQAPRGRSGSPPSSGFNVNNSALVAIDSPTGEIVSVRRHRSTTTTARHPRCRASSTWPVSAGGSRDRPSSRSRTRRPSSRATRPSARCSWTR